MANGRLGTGFRRERVQTLASKLKRNLRDFGLGITLRKSLGYLFGFFYRSTVYRIYRMDLRRHNPRPPTEDEFIFRTIGQGDKACIQQIESMEEWLEGMVASKLANGGLCLVAMDKDAVAGFNIVGFGEVYMPLVRMRKTFLSDSAWSEQITVHNRYRGKGLGSELRYRMFAELKTRGYNRFFGGTLSNNLANLKLSKKVGFQEIADIRYVRILGKERRYISRVRN